MATARTPPNLRVVADQERGGDAAARATAAAAAAVECASTVDGNPPRTAKARETPSCRHCHVPMTLCHCLSSCCSRCEQNGAQCKCHSGTPVPRPRSPRSASAPTKCQECYSLQLKVKKLEIALQRKTQLAATTRAAAVVHESSGMGVTAMIEEQRRRVVLLEEALQRAAEAIEASKQQQREILARSQERILRTEQEARIACVEGRTWQKELNEARSRIAHLCEDLRKTKGVVKEHASAMAMAESREKLLRAELHTVGEEKNSLEKKLQAAEHEIAKLDSATLTVEVRNLRNRVAALQATANAFEATQRELARSRYVLSGKPTQRARQHFSAKSLPTSRV
mmetsp:Transcript_14381/g.28068  ORF Transcript_14381/g.28068 Transcript_14381/m.28068 type:complete len:340 (+) Transcript_14381:225-1244(+)